MKIGIVADGEAEVSSLPILCNKIQPATEHSLVSPIKTSAHPAGPIEKVARVRAKDLDLIKRRSFDRVIVLLDREQRDDCCGATAAAIADALQQRGVWPFEIEIVLKDRMFENWLVADVEALRLQQGRFRVDEGTARSIASGAADNLDASALLKKWTIKPPSYQKVKDSVRIMEQADPVRMAMTSRSFRRFLRCIGHPDYVQQSRLPLPHR